MDRGSRSLMVGTLLTTSNTPFQALYLPRMGQRFKHFQPHPLRLAAILLKYGTQMGTYCRNMWNSASKSLAQPLTLTLSSLLSTLRIMPPLSSFLCQITFPLPMEKPWRWVLLMRWGQIRQQRSLGGYLPSLQTTRFKWPRLLSLMSAHTRFLWL